MHGEINQTADHDQIILVDISNQAIGFAPKLASHHHNTPLHRAFSCFIFNSVGQLLVTRRALTKKVFPGIWTNSCCGHPLPGEKNRSSGDPSHRTRARYNRQASTNFARLSLPSPLPWDRRK